MDSQAVLSLLKEELASEEAVVRVNAIRRLPLVAAALGGGKASKDSLLALIDKLARETDEDELLFGLAEGLLRLAAYFRVSMLPILERLAVVEETVVRDKACECVVALFRQAEPAELAGSLVPAIQRLAQSESVIAKISAVNLIGEVYSLVGESDRRAFIERINTMFNEDSLMLRRVLASKLGVLCQYMSKDQQLGEVLHHLKTLGSDDSDQVKMLTIESLVQLAKLFSIEENKTHVVPLVIQMTNDKSWKVKHHLAKEFANLAHAVGPEITDNSLISIFSALLRDPENEVRTIAVKSLKKFVGMISAEKVSMTIVYLSGLTKDSVPLVRMGACEVLQVILEGSLDPATEKETIKFRVQPFVSELLQDREIEVKIEAIRLLKPLIKFQGPAVLELLSSGVYLLDFESPNWRIRYATLQALLEISHEFRSQKVFEKSIKKFFNQAAYDRACNVRKLAVQSLKKLSEYLDQPSLSSMLKDFAKIAGNPREFYAYRISALYAIEALAPVCEDSALVKETVTRCLLPLLEDKVPNVRQVVAQILLRSDKPKPIKECDSEVVSALAKAAEKETDREVKLILTKAN